MVGLVVVAHSPALAQAAVDLALEMVTGQPPRVAIAAGVAGGFGTDAVAVQNAIEQVDDGDGVVVLMDLGSAVLSSEMALELLDHELRERVHLTSAPLVEGLVAAVVQAAAGETPEVVIREATAGLAGKEAQLGTSTVTAETTGEDEGGQRAVFTVSIPHGLHARPAARLVTTTKGFDAEVRIRNTTTASAYAPAASLSRVAAVGARQGHQVEVVASGRQAAAALEAILALAGRGFDEQPAASAPPAPASGGPLPASPGIGIGPKWTIGGGDVMVPETGGEVDAESEWHSLQTAISATRPEISQTQDRLLRSGDRQNAAIFDAHLMLLEDTEILNDVKHRIEGGAAAAAAWKTALEAVEAEWAALDNAYLNARTADVRAVRNQVLRQLLGERRHITSQPGILVTNDLAPNDIAVLDPDLVAGIVTAAGSPTSHTAVLARALGIPAVVAAGNDVLDIAAGTELIVDGTAGTVLVDPSPATVDDYRARATQMATADSEASGRAQQPAVTSDGVVISVAANIGPVSDALIAVAGGADAIGVLRTEFLFLERTDPPSVAEQEAEYRRIAEALGGRRLTIRTLDVGGDKPIDYLPLPQEANPFLGIRGIRVSLRHPELLHAQLTAAVQVASDHPVSVLFPMVATVAELDETLAIVDTVYGEQGGRPADFEVGIMVEVPAVAANAAVFARRVDFFSIGTNDLAQYALAAERGNPSVAGLSDALDPGVLRLLTSVVAGAGDSTKVAVCGEIAADLTAVPVLIGLGVDELSVTPYAVPRVKDEVRRWSKADAVVLAAEVIDLESAGAVRAAVERRR
jgi:phosphoenolpyruvate-protein phosphotransferase/dihydroxyacetone kinase phosphotransfer subunit